MEKIFDYENPNLWSKHIKQIMDKYLNKKILDKLLNISNDDDNRYIEIKDIYEFTSDSIFSDVSEYVKQNNCFVKLYHATATDDIESYLKNGLYVLKSEEKNKYARQLFNQEAFPALTDEKFNIAINEHLNYLGMNLRENRISFMTHKEHLLKNETHYLIYGSEYIFILAQRLGYRYESFLRDKLKPTLLTCKIPFDLLNDDFISMTISNIIVKYIENIIYPEEIYKNDAEIYITSNLEAKNIIKYEHPKNIICTHF